VSAEIQPWFGEPITKPGLYRMSELAYHADPVKGGSLSSTMLRQILKSPAHLRHYLDSPRVEKAAFDFGHAVHAGVLGVGLELVEIPEDVLASNGAASTTAAKTFIADAYAAGKVPLKHADIAPIRASVEAVKNHELAATIFAKGEPEVSAFAQDPVTGVWLRARIDWVTPDGTLVDLKTTVDGEPGKFEREGRRLGYDVQAAFYRHVYALATGADAVAFQFVTVEKSAPYLVDVHAPLDWPHLGEQKREKATALYADCLATNTWPGRPAVVNTTPSPLWAFDDDEMEVSE
jgi:hypothetical protein